MYAWHYKGHYCPRITRQINVQQQRSPVCYSFTHFAHSHTRVNFHIHPPPIHRTASGSKYRKQQKIIWKLPKKQNLQTTKHKRLRWNCHIWKSGNYHEMYNYFWGWVRITIFPHFQKRFGLWLGFFHTSTFYQLLLKNLPQFIWAVLNFHNTPIAISAARTLKISLYNNFLVILPYFSFYYHLLSVFRTLLRVFGSIWFIFGIFGCFRYLATPQWPHTAVCGTPSTNRHLSAI